MDLDAPEQGAREPEHTLEQELVNTQEPQAWEEGVVACMVLAWQQEHTWEPEARHKLALQAWEGVVEACREPELEQGAPQTLEGDGKVWEAEPQQSVPSLHT